MNGLATRVKCGNCHQYHSSAAEVKSCYFPPITKLCMTIEPHAGHPVQGAQNVTCPGVPSATVAQSGLTVERPTQRQLDYVHDLGGDVELAKKYTRKGVSHYIDRLKKGDGVVTPVVDLRTQAPNRTETKVPLDMLNAVPDGYFAVQQDSNKAHTFFRFSHPKHSSRSRFAGALKIQTQHGPDYELALVVWPSGKVTVYNKSVEDDLLLVVVDPNGAAIRYAEKIGRCMRCNTELTDERSRWFGIGPECEKHWPHIIHQQTERKGPFVFGQA